VLSIMVRLSLLLGFAIANKPVKECGEMDMGKGQHYQIKFLANIIRETPEADAKCDAKWGYSKAFMSERCAKALFNAFWGYRYQLASQQTTCSGGRDMFYLCPRNEGKWFYAVVEKTKEAMTKPEAEAKAKKEQHKKEESEDTVDRSESTPEDARKELAEDEVSTDTEPTCKPAPPQTSALEVPQELEALDLSIEFCEPDSKLEMFEEKPHFGRF